MVASPITEPDEDWETTVLDAAGAVVYDTSIVFDLGGDKNDRPLAATAQRDGKFVVVGYAQDSTTRGNSVQAAVARFTSDGDLDASFAGTGKTTVNFVGDAIATAVAIAPDGKVVVAGYYWSGAHGYDVFVLRYLASGTLDTSFDANGIRTFGFDLGESDNSDIVTSVAVQRDGKIVVGATVANVGHTDWGVARLNLDGSLDATFGTSGLETLDIGGATDDSLVALLVDRWGKIVVGGNTSNGDVSAVALGRLLADGSLDTTFGGFAGGLIGLSDDPVVALTLGPPLEDALYYLTSAGKVAALRFDGSVDPSFGDGGAAYYAPFADGSLEPSSLTASGGKLVIGGTADSRVVVGRLWMHRILGTDFETGDLRDWGRW